MNDCLRLTHVNKKRHANPHAICRFVTADDAQVQVDVDGDSHNDKYDDDYGND